MDKYEYKERLSEISRLVDDEDFQGAIKIVDTIDWKRVKSARTLCMVGEIYEANGRYDESMQILRIAYERAPIVKFVLYQLVELAVKMKDFDSAVEYYNEFVEKAPNDNTKYILKYRIYRARRSPIKDQITILEAYKKREYTERWAYELARLYAKAGMREKCVEECDDLILWFSEGKFVTKAMELKMGFAPLTPDQRIKYQNRFAVKENPAEEPKEVTQSGEEPKEDQTSPESEKPEEEQEKDTKDEDMKPAVSEPSVFAPILESTNDFQEKIVKGIRDVLSGKQKAEEEILSTEKPQEEESLEEELPLEEISYMDIQSTEDYVVKDLEPEEFEAVASPSDAHLSSAIKSVAAATEAIGKVKAATADPFLMPAIEPRKEPEEEQIEGQMNLKDFDMDAFLAETTSTLAQELSSEEKKTDILEEAAPEEEPAIEESEPEDPIIEEIEAEELMAEEIFTEEAVFESPEAEKAEVEAVVSAYFESEEPQPREDIGDANTRYHLAKEDHKRIFTYFEKVPGMKEQITETLDITQNHVCDRTSKMGNIIIVGRKGSGKTRLAQGMVKAICKERRMEAAKVAYIDASVINEKDPAGIVSKLSGGFLAIERAGALTAEAVEKLSKAMDFRTDRLTIILEDEKLKIQALMKTHEEFAKKFDATIAVPVFTNDELVSFARTYAKEMGYRMDEMGVLALYTKIGDNQKEDEPMTVEQVKNMVDKAIYKAEKGTRKLGRRISKKHVDDESRVFLYEKDFD